MDKKKRYINQLIVNCETAVQEAWLKAHHTRTAEHKAAGTIDRLKLENSLLKNKVACLEANIESMENRAATNLHKGWGE